MTDQERQALNGIRSEIAAQYAHVPESWKPALSRCYDALGEAVGADYLAPDQSLSGLHQTPRSVLEPDAR